jgi:hypothetical protein
MFDQLSGEFNLLELPATTRAAQQMLGHPARVLHRQFAATISGKFFDHMLLKHLYSPSWSAPRK